MALSGTLSDLGIVDLIQFPNAGRKTGELVLAGADGEGRLYYSKGKLVHVAYNEEEGLDALVEIVGWEEGEFEFRLGVETAKSTIEMDLHRTLMQALKLRDERAEAKRKDEAVQLDPSIPTDEIKAAIDTFVEGNAVVERAMVVGRRGEVVAERKMAGDQGNDVETLVKTIAGLWGDYPRKDLERVFLDDGEGIVVASAIGSSLLLIISVGSDVSLGMATVTAGKLAAAVTEVVG